MTLHSKLFLFISEICMTFTLGTNRWEYLGHLSVKTFLQAKNCSSDIRSVFYPHNSKF